MGRGSSKAGGGSAGSSAIQRAEQNIYALKTTKKAAKEELKDAPIGTTLAYNFPAGHSIVYEKIDYQDAMYNNYWAKTTISKDGSFSSSRLAEASVADDIISWNKSKTITNGFNEENKKKYKKAQNGIIKEMERP